MRELSEKELRELAEPPFEAPPMLADREERRMHVRAHRYWLSRLAGRPFPSIADLDPAALDEFAPYSLLLDCAGDLASPQLRFVGQRLRDQCGLDGARIALDAVPSWSLISQLSDYYLDIIAKRAPVDFESEFVPWQGAPILYRGILLPLASKGSDIDFVYGVIGWKQLADTNTTTELAIELAQILGGPTPAAPKTASDEALFQTTPTRRSAARSNRR